MKTFFELIKLTDIFYHILHNFRLLIVSKYSELSDHFLLFFKNCLQSENLCCLDLMRLLIFLGTVKLPPIFDFKTFDAICIFYWF